MAKISGLDVRLYTEGYDLSGDANALDGLGYTEELQEIPVLNLSGMQRQGGRTDGHVSVNAWFDNASNQQHDAWLASSKLPTGDRLVMIPLALTIGDGVAMLRAKQASYNVSNQAGSALAASAEFQANDFGLEFGITLTAGKVTDASATNHTSVDGSASSSAGGIGQVQVFSLGSGTVVPIIQDSADNSSFAAITGLTFTGAAARAAERLATSSTATIRRYVRFASTGTFTNAVLAVGFQRG